MKGIFIGGFFSFLLFFIFPAQTNALQVTIDGEEQAFEQNVIIENGRALLPMRALFEAIDAEVYWDQAQQEVSASMGEYSLVLPINRTEAFVNGQVKQLDTAVKLVNGRTFVPLRFVSQSIGAEVNYEGDTQQIHITTEPKVKGEPPAEQLPSIAGIELGEDIGEVDALVEEARRITTSAYDFNWHTYHNQYENFIQVGVNAEEEIVALFTNEPTLWADSLPAYLQEAEMNQLFGDSISRIDKNGVSYQYEEKEEWSIHQFEDTYLTAFYDLQNEREVTGMKLIDADVKKEKDGFYGDPSTELQEAYEWQMLDLLNAIRVKHGIEPLTWHESAARIAKAHSEDMAENSYFAHDNLDGQSPFDRMRAAQIDYVRAGENLAVGQISSIYATEDLLNSVTHRQNILNADFTHVGIGVAHEDDKPYFTQNYVTPTK
ncbi:stalk domain-containing protein [Salsuginibacillus kocurii]|uniref:stalk domain-containing protein n=1 Tax=Salsuginibacillus kocurii TaxID=427078 RepID=UPI0003770626|nr:stalk domain-containing protein [Salsuginibacillus kocurii]